jgi:hypothetical protein
MTEFLTLLDEYVWALAVAVFIAITVLDIVWALYIQAVADKHAIKAGILSMVLIAIGGFSTIAYVHNIWLILPELLGAFCGTYLTIRFGKKN